MEGKTWRELIHSKPVKHKPVKISFCFALLAFHCFDISLSLSPSLSAPHPAASIYLPS